MARGAPIIANQVKALISKIYNIGISRDIVEHNPCFDAWLEVGRPRTSAALREVGTS